MLSRLSGLVRDSVLAGVFGGHSLSFDAFLVANRIPNLLRELLAEGALGSAFTKTYSSLAAQDRQAADRFAQQIFEWTFLVSLVVSILGVVAAPALVAGLMLAAADVGEKQELARQATILTRILFPFIGLMSLASVVSGVLHTRGRFLVSGVSPVMLNLGYIVGAISLGGLASVFAVKLDAEVFGLAIGVLLGGLAQLLFLMLGGGVRVSLRWPTWSSSAEVRQLFALMLPMILAGSAGQVNIVVNTNFATQMETGAVTWLNYAFRVTHLPIGVFAVAIATALLPNLAQAAATQGSWRHSMVSSQLARAIEACLWLMSFCSLVLWFHASDIVTILFQHGQFTASDAAHTAAALRLYGLGLTGYGLMKVLTSFYYVANKTNIAMGFSLFSIFVNFFSNYYFSEVLGFQGLAVTAALVVTIQSLLMLGWLVWQKMPLLTLEYLRRWIFAGGVILLLVFLYSRFVEFIQLQPLDSGKIRAFGRLALGSVTLGALMGPSYWLMRRMFDMKGNSNG